MKDQAPRWRKTLHVGLLLLTWSACVAYAWNHLDHGWVPHDEGTLAQPATRLLQGELSHRDFDDTYTGGLAFLNAAAFKVFGEDLFSMRLVMFGFFVAWIPAMYYVARRFAGPVTAALATVCGVAFSIPNYPAALPSWYNLFLTVFAVAALLRYLSVLRARWLVIAGIVAGLSILVKITGLYLVAAALMSFAFIEQTRSTEERSAREPSCTDAVRDWYSFGAIGLAVLGTIMIAGLVRDRAGVQGVFHFIFPAAIVFALFVMRERSAPPEPRTSRLRRFGRLGIPFAVGVALPLLVFATPYALTGSLSALIRGVFVAPMQRFDFASIAPPGLGKALYALPLAALVMLGQRMPRAELGRRVLITGAVFAPLCAVTWMEDVYKVTWAALHSLPPFIVLGGALALTFRPRRSTDEVGLAEKTLPDEAALIPIVALAFGTLIQFPFAAAVYFVYIAPLAILAAVASIGVWDRRPNAEFAVLLGFATLFMVARVHGGTIFQMSHEPGRDTQTEHLALERASLRVSSEDKAVYEAVVGLLREHGGDGYAYVTPDSPELYFLSGLANPTRNIFEFLADSVSEPQRILELLEEKGVQVVVLNFEPHFSEPPSPRLLDELATRYPASTEVDRFVIRWQP